MQITCSPFVINQNFCAFFHFLAPLVLSMRIFQGIGAFFCAFELKKDYSSIFLFKTASNLNFPRLGQHGASATHLEFNHFNQVKCLLKQ